MKQRTGVCPGIKHSTVCRPYFDRLRQLKFEILPGFWTSCIAGILTLLWLGLSLTSFNEEQADARLVGCSLAASPVLVYLCWTIRKEGSVQMFELCGVVLFALANAVINLPETLPSPSGLSYLLPACVCYSCRNIAIKHSAKDFQSNTSTICSMMTAGFFGLLWAALFSVSDFQLEQNPEFFLSCIFALSLYCGLAGLNYAIVHGSVATSTALSIIPCSLVNVVFSARVTLWGNVTGSVCFLGAFTCLLLSQTNPITVSDDPTKPVLATNEIEDSGGFYMPLLEGANVEVI